MQLEIPLILTWVQPGEHTKADLDLILEADVVQPLIDRIPLLQIDHRLRTGQMQLFRTVPGPGVILTEIRTAHGVKRLNLIRGAGKMAWQLRVIVKLLGVTAREWGCECVETVVYSDRVRQALERCGAETEGWVMKYSETSDGQQD